MQDCLHIGLNLLKINMVSFISVICPTFNEEKYISNCLDAIIQSDYPKDYLEVLIIDGISTYNTK